MIQRAEPQSELYEPDDSPPTSLTPDPLHPILLIHRYPRFHEVGDCLGPRSPIPSISDNEGFIVCCRSFLIIRIPRAVNIAELSWTGVDLLELPALRFVALQLSLTLTPPSHSHQTTPTGFCEYNNGTCRILRHS